MNLKTIIIFALSIAVLSVYPLIKLIDNGSHTLRLIWWGNTCHMIVDNPITGVGLGNFKLEYPKYIMAYKRDWSFTEGTQLTRVHNDHLQFFAELGIIGFIPYCAMFIYVTLMFRIIWRSADERKKTIALGAWLSILAFIIVGMTSFPWERTLMPLLLFTNFAVIKTLYERVGHD